MSSRKPCIKCGRQIDEWSKLCPFCNWSQDTPVPANDAAAQPMETYTPPAEKTWRNRMIIAAGGILLLIAAFGVGYLINKDDAVEKAPEPVTQADDREKTKVRRNEVELVPVNEPMGETPITSAPVGDVAAGDSSQYDRSDATAVGSEEYAQLAARAQAERLRAKAIVDPRTLTGTAYAQAPRAAAPRRATPPTGVGEPSGGGTMSIRTRPVPIEQPLPSISVSQRTVAKLDLVIDEDGSVREVDVRQAVAGETPRLIQAVQRWRFKPATENGRRVASRFSVEVTFNP